MKNKLIENKEELYLFDGVITIRPLYIHPEGTELIRAEVIESAVSRWPVGYVCNWNVTRMRKL